MATKSIYKNVYIRDKASADRLLFALESAEERAAETAEEVDKDMQ